jgi:hypothetical protein
VVRRHYSMPLQLALVSDRGFVGDPQAGGDRQALRM